jgi:pimeloyl-ACP methyl ester carboxylesterase
MSASDPLPLDELARWSPPLPPADGFRHRMIETPGLRTHLAEIGEGEPVLLLHGFPEHWWQWREVARGLAAAGYRADPRIGRRTRLGDVLALLDALELDRVRLLSHDMGALTAMALCYDHPERVISAVQLSVPPAFFSVAPRIAPGFRHLPGFLLHRRGASLRGIFSPAYVARGMSEETKDRHLAPLRRPGIDAAVRPLTLRHVLPEAMAMLSGSYARRRLEVPTLVVFGREDHPWSEPVLRRICRRSERSAERFELSFVDDAAHFLTDDAPSEVCALTLDWFARTR